MTAIQTTADLAYELYRRVDTGDIDGLVAMFTEDAEYHRPGYPPAADHAGIDHFYRHERVIASGVHTLEAVAVTGTEMGVRGTFVGAKHDGTPLSLRFADFFTLSADNRFVRRETFFSAPLA